VEREKGKEEKKVVKEERVRREPFTAFASFFLLSSHLNHRLDIFTLLFLLLNCYLSHWLIPTFILKQIQSTEQKNPSIFTKKGIIMNRIFGKKKEVAPPPSLGDATNRIDGNVARLDEKIAKLEGELRRYKEQMKTAKGSSQQSIKKRAMQTLKQKKMYEAQRDQMVQQGFNIDSTKFAIDMVQDQQVAVQALKAAAVTLKAEQSKIKLDDVEDMHDDMEDLMEEMESINEVGIHFIFYVFLLK
jgi:hypothetical protein